MRAKHVFGLTPWGRYFIEAMEDLADEGRLARGRSYAGNGAVFELVVDGGSIKAKVEGNYAPYYRVSIRFRQLSAKAAAVVQEAFDSDPLLSARIAAGDLPEGLVERLEKKGVSLVPRSWSEIERSCTCPDDGDPCKHQAAVYYLLAQEIDRDPLVLFRLRGVAPHGIAQTGVTPDTKRRKQTQGASSGTDTIPQASIPEPFVPQLVPPWPEIDGDYADPLAGLGALSNYTVAIPALLPPSRGLTPFDLRVLCSAMYIEAAGSIPALLEPGAGKAPVQVTATEGPNDDARSRAFAASRFDIRLDPDGLAAIKTAAHGKLGVLAASRLFAACGERDGSASYRFLRSFFAAARSIASACAFAPDVRVADGRFSVLWKPARFASDVDALLTALEPAVVCPSYVPAKRKTPPPGTQPAAEPKAAALVPDRRSTVEMLANAFLTDLVASLGFAPPSVRDAAHPAVRALFGKGYASCSEPGEMALPGALDAWLSVYDMAARRPPLEMVISAASRQRSKSRAKTAIDQSDPNTSYHLSAAFIGDDGRRVALRDTAKAGGKRAGEALSFAALLSNFVPALGTLGVEPFATLTEDELARFVIDAAPLFERFGVAIVLPKELRKLARPRPALRATKKAGLVSYLDLATAFSFDWTVAIGEERLSVAEFSALVDSGLRLVRWRDQWVRIDAKEAAGVLARVSARKAPGAMEALRIALSGDTELEGELAGAVDFLVGAGRRSADDAAVPASLCASLRPYQERGYRWMLGNFDRRYGAREDRAGDSGDAVPERCWPVRYRQAASGYPGLRSGLALVELGARAVKIRAKPERLYLLWYRQAPAPGGRHAVELRNLDTRPEKAG